MAPPLLPVTRLVVCAACVEHVKVSDDHCPHCGVTLPGRAGLLARAAGVALVGVMLVGCSEPQALYGIPATSEGLDTAPSTGSSGNTGEGTTTADSSGTAVPTSTGSESNGTSAPTTDDTTSSDTTSSDTTSSDTTSSDTTTSDTTTGGSESSGSSSTTMAPQTTGDPDYGVPSTTTQPEPEYGVPGTT